MIVLRSAVAAAGLLAAPAVRPVLPAPALVSLAPSLSAPALTPALIPTPGGVPAASDPLPGPASDAALERLVSRGWLESGPWLIALREGRDERGRRVLTLDALDAAAPGRGTIGHLDFVLQDGGLPVVLDGPLDAPADPARLPPGAADADLSHRRPHLWFGFAVVPEWQGRGLGAALLDLGTALIAREGAGELIVYATESSRGFYRARYGARVLADEPFTGADESVYHRLVVRVRP